MPLAAALLGPSAGADDKTPLGGGAGILVGGRYCTLNTIGQDKTGQLVGFTAAHCGGPGAVVIADGAQNRVPLGTVATVGDGLDYSVIRFDPAKVSPTANFAGFPIDGIGPDPDVGAPACTRGAATGDQCSHIVTVPGPGPGRSMLAPFQPGDDGRPVTSDDLLIGLVVRRLHHSRRHFGEPPDAGHAINFVQRHPGRRQCHRRAGRWIHAGSGLTNLRSCGQSGELVTLARN